VGDRIGNIYHNTLPAQAVQWDVGYALATGVKGRLTHKVSTHSVAPIEQLAIGPRASTICAGYSLEKVDFQSLLAWKRRRKDAAPLGQVIKPGSVHNINELFPIHGVSSYL
jgi:hypothetical protein